MTSRHKLDTAENIFAHAKRVVDQRPGATDRRLVTPAAYQALIVQEIASLFTGRDLSELSADRCAAVALMFQLAFQIAYQAE